MVKSVSGRLDPARRESRQADLKPTTSGRYALDPKRKRVTPETDQGFRTITVQLPRFGGHHDAAIVRRFEHRVERQCDQYIFVGGRDLTSAGAVREGNVCCAARSGRGEGLEELRCGGVRTGTTGLCPLPENVVRRHRGERLVRRASWSMARA
jgi:hypothetical protein